MVKDYFVQDIYNNDAKHLIPLQVLNDTYKRMVSGVKFEEDVRLLICIINWKKCALIKFGHIHNFWSLSVENVFYAKFRSCWEMRTKLHICDFINTETHIWNRKIIFSENYYYKLKKDWVGVQKQHPLLVRKIDISSYTQLTINVFLWANLRMLLPISKRIQKKFDSSLLVHTRRRTPNALNLCPHEIHATYIPLKFYIVQHQHPRNCVLRIIYVLFKLLRLLLFI